MDSDLLRDAERRLMVALRRLHAAQPLQPDHRIDAVRRAVQAAPTARSRRHRGGSVRAIDDPTFDAALDALVAAGRVERNGRRIQLTGNRPVLGDQMRARANALLDALRAAGVTPPRAETVARNLGVPVAVVEGMRAAGELVSIAPGIDYPADVLADLVEHLAGAVTGEPSRAAIIDELGVSRRYADALLSHLTRDSRAVR